jgi:hypothetical protein
MKFIVKKIRQYSEEADLSLLKGMNKQLFITKQENGIPCIIINGLVCDSSGTPFKNTNLQSEFEFIAKRFMGCKTIILGTIKIADRSSYSCMSDYTESRLKIMEVVNSTSERYKKGYLEIVIENGVSEFNSNMPYRTMHGMISGIIKSIQYAGVDYLNSQKIKMVPVIEVNSNDEASIRSIIKSNSIIFKNTLIIDPDSVYYNEDGDYTKQLVSFNLNKLGSYKIKKIYKQDLGELSGFVELMTEMISSLDVEVSKGKILRVDMTGIDEFRRCVLLKSITDGNIKEIYLYGFSENKKTNLNLP